MGGKEGERGAIPPHELRVSSMFNNATMLSRTWILCFCAFMNFMKFFEFSSKKIHISFQSN